MFLSIHIFFKLIKKLKIKSFILLIKINKRLKQYFLIKIMIKDMMVFFNLIEFVISVCLHSARPFNSISMQTRYDSDLFSSALLYQSLESLMFCSLNDTLFIIWTRLIDCFSSNLISALIRLINSRFVRSDLYIWHDLSLLICPI